MRLGPLGELRHIAPLAGVREKSERFGGVHTSLTGRRTVDHLGSAREWELTFKPQPPTDELAWLRALYTRHVPGPLRLLLDGVHTNRLSLSAASVGLGGVDMSAVAVSAGARARGQGWPAQAWPAGIPLQWSGWDTGDTLTLDRGQPAPILPGETVTGYVWVRGDAAHQVDVSLVPHTANGEGAAIGGGTVTLAADTWAQLPVTATPGDKVYGAHLALSVDARDAAGLTLTVAAAQVAPGDTAGAWTQGGGAPVVEVDQRQTTLLYAPLSNPTMTLLEL